MRNHQAEALSMMGGLEILSVPVLSLNHLTKTEGTMEYLWWPRDARCHEWHDSVFVCTKGDAPSEHAWPGWLRVQAWARGAGYEWVMLSPDGAEIPGLEVYPW